MIQKPESPQPRRVRRSKVKGGTATTIRKNAVSQPFYQNLSYITQTLRKAAKMLKVRQASFLNVVHFPALLRITNTKKGRFSYQQLDVNMSGSCAASHMAPSLVLLAAVVLKKHSPCNRHKGSPNC